MTVRTPAGRFLGLVHKQADGCWLWAGSMKRRDYGGFSLDRKVIGAHKAAWILFRGPIPDGKHVLHRCDVPSCVNPAHLFLGSMTDNMRDMVMKGRAATAKLTPAKVLEIYRSGDSVAVASARYGMHPNSVSNIRTGRTWTAVTGAKRTIYDQAARRRASIDGRAIPRVTP